VANKTFLKAGFPRKDIPLILVSECLYSYKSRLF